MKKIIFLLLLVSTVGFAQTPKKVVVEHFTNSRCSVCAANNPALFTTLQQHPDVIHIAYYPSSPYSNCYFSLQNPTENDGRANYYGVYGATPRVVVEGAVSNPSNPVLNPALLTNNAGQTSPFAIHTQLANVSGTDYTMEVNIETTGSVPSGNYIAFVALAEDTIAYTSANGETHHYDVFRKALTAVTGQSFTPATNGSATAITLNNSGVINSATYPNWNWNRVKVFVVVQNQATKAIVQADYNRLNNLISGTTAITPQSNSWVVAPNPVSNTIYFHHNPTTVTDEVVIRIYSLDGKLVAEEKSSDSDPAVDFTRATPGVYVYELFSPQSQAVVRGKIIKN